MAPPFNEEDEEEEVAEQKVNLDALTFSDGRGVEEEKEIEEEEEEAEELVEDEEETK